MDMSLFSSHANRMREVKEMRTNQDRLMSMIKSSNVRPGNMMPNGGGLFEGGGIPNGGGLMYGHAGNGMAEFGQGYHPELRKIMKADDTKLTGLGNTNDEDEIYAFGLNGINEEDAFVAVAEAPVEVKKPVYKKKSNSRIVTVEGTVKEIRTNHKITADVLPKPGVDYVLSEVSTRQKEVLQKAMAKAGSITQFKPRGNKMVVAIDADGSVTKYKSLIKAHTALGVTKHQLFGGKTPKENYGSHYNAKLQKLLALVDKDNSNNFD